jgi:hypothetical protein
MNRRCEHEFEIKETYKTLNEWGSPVEVREEEEICKRCDWMRRKLIERLYDDGTKKP